MIVSVKGQVPGAAHAVPRPGGGDVPPVRGAAPHGRPDAPANAPSSGASQPASTGVSTTGRALFDANGDGTIENWGFAHGGDSFATFDPPPPGADTHPVHRGANVPTDADLHVASPSHNPGHTGTPAAIHHAHDAYRRDGLAGAPSQPVAHSSTAPPYHQLGDPGLRAVGSAVPGGVREQ